MQRRGKGRQRQRIPRASAGSGSDQISAPVADFIALGPEIWSAEDPLTVLTELWR